MGAMASDLGIRSSKFTSGIFRAKLILSVSKKCRKEGNRVTRLRKEGRKENQTRQTEQFKLQIGKLDREHAHEKLELQRVPKTQCHARCERVSSEVYHGFNFHNSKMLCKYLLPASPKPLPSALTVQPLHHQQPSATCSSTAT